MSEVEVTEEMINAAVSAMADLYQRERSREMHVTWRESYAAIYRAMHLHRPLSEGPQS